jgi:hypothetical protein
MGEPHVDVPCLSHSRLWSCAADSTEIAARRLQSGIRQGLRAPNPTVIGQHPDQNQRHSHGEHVVERRLHAGVWTVRTSPKPTGWPF